MGKRNMGKVSPGGGGATVLPAARTQHQHESRMPHNIVDALSREREWGKTAIVGIRIH